MTKYTPAGITAARLRLGISLNECADYFGVGHGFMRTLESRKIDHVYKGMVDALAALEESMGVYSGSVVRPPRPAYVIYANQADFCTFDPPAAEYLRLVCIHRMAITNAQSYADFIYSRTTPIVTLDPADYCNFLGERQNSAELRTEWAAGYAKRYTLREGLPVSDYDMAKRKKA